MGMMSALVGLFGGGEKTSKALDIADKTLSGVGGFIDGLSYTDQEKAEHIGKAVDAHLRLVEATANENSLRSVTRRWLAFGIVGYTLFWGSLAMVFAIIGKVTDDAGSVVFDGVAVVDRMIAVMTAFSLGIAFVAVVGLYFGVQFLRK